MALEGKEILVHERLGHVLKEEMLIFVVNERLGDVFGGKCQIYVKFGNLKSMTKKGSSEILAVEKT